MPSGGVRTDDISGPVAMVKNSVGQALMQVLAWQRHGDVRVNKQTPRPRSRTLSFRKRLVFGRNRARADAEWPREKMDIQRGLLSRERERERDTLGEF